MDATKSNNSQDTPTVPTAADVPTTWRRRKLDHPEDTPLVFRRLLCWLLADDANGNWWMSTSQMFLFNTFILVVLLAGLGFLYYSGVLTLALNWLQSVFTIQVGKKSVCGQSLRVKHNIHDLRQLMDAATWEEHFAPPFKNITQRELKQGFISLEYPTHLTEINVDLGDLQNVMSRLSAVNASCICGADLFVPYNIFGFDGKVYWHVAGWSMPPHGARTSCGEGWGEVSSFKHAKGTVARLCGEKDAVVVFDKGALCCMAFCERSRGSFN